MILFFSDEDRRCGDGEQARDRHGNAPVGSIDTEAKPWAGLGFRVQGLGFRVSGFGFRV